MKPGETKHKRQTLGVGAISEGEKRILGLAKRAENGDTKALSEISKIFEKEPVIWEAWGDLATQAEEVLIKAASGDNLMVREGLSRKLETLKSELAGPSPSPLERLLAHRVAACWLQVHYADSIYAQNMDQREQGEYYQRRQDRAHKRFLTAVKTLAQVRRLLFPPDQL